MKRYTATEALSFIYGDIDLVDGDSTLDENLSDTINLADIDSCMSNLDQEFETELLRNVASNFTDPNIEFEEISQATQQENENEQDEIETRKRKSSPIDDWKQNVAKRRRSLGLSYQGKKMVDGTWTTVERGEKKWGGYIQEIAAGILIANTVMNLKSLIA